MTRLIVLLPLVLCACAGARHLQGLPQRDVAALNRCMTDVAPRVCQVDMTDPNEDWIMQNTCRSTVSKHYRAAPDRQAWLVQHGCPEQVAGVYRGQ